MALELNLSVEDTEAMIQAALIKGGIGKHLNEAVQEALGSYNSPIKKAVEMFVREVAEGLVRDKYADSIRKIVTEHVEKTVTQEVLDKITAMSIDKIVNSNY